MSESRGEIPKKIDRYEIIEAVGYGAMGAVYKAFDPLIKRPVAVKTLRLDVPPQSPDYRAFLDRFATEARTAGRLSHPNIITLYDVGHTKDQVPWLAMEYVEGQTVAELLEGERLRPEVVVGLVSQIAAAIDYAHTEGVIHRDIKPSNVIVFGGEKVKVTDFGIAKLMDADVTQSGLMMGTPSYMSPEQAMGEELDGRTDIFSLGVVAFEMLSGQQPFPGNNVTSILYKLVHSEPVHPEDLEVLGLLPDRWHQVFSRVLAKESADRFATAAEFVEELERCLGSWFGALEGETVIVNDPAALLGDETGESDETMMDTPEPPDQPEGKKDRVARAARPGPPGPTDTIVPVDADALDEDTATLQLRALSKDEIRNADTVTHAPPATGEETVFAPPPVTSAEETLYAGGADATVTGTDAVDETVIDAKAAPPPVRPAKRGGTRSVVLAGVALAAVLAAIAIFLPSGGTTDEAVSEPAPAVEPGDVAPSAPPVVTIESGVVILQSEPEGADVLVDGQLAGTTPIELELPLDEHEIVVDRDGYVPERVTAALTDEERTQTIELVLRAEPPRPALVRIRSEPTGARVEIDGNVVGSTPTDALEVSAGARAVRITRDGYLPWEDTVRARQGRTVDVDAVLTERPRARVEPEAPPEPSGPPQVEVGTLVDRGEPGVVNPVCIECPAVRYPEPARRARLEGVVELAFIIDENGRATDIRVQESAGDVFDSAVTQAVTQWRWSPATKYDVPVKIRWVQRFRFRQGR